MNERPVTRSVNVPASAGRNPRAAIIEDAADQAAMQPWIPMECFQLERGKRLAQMHTLDLGSERIVRETQNVAVQKLGVTPPDLCTISCCTRDPAFRFSEMRAGKSDPVFFMPENTEFDIYVPGGAQTNYVSLSQKEFLDKARILNPSEWEEAPQGLLTVEANRQADLEEAISLWLAAEGARGTSAPARSSGLLREMILDQIVRIVTTLRQPDALPSPRERSRSFHICRSARAFVENCVEADVMPTVIDICRRVGVSERSLQYAFHAYVNCSPQAYLRMCRLNRVRATLRAADPRLITVTDVATRFGFFHLGRFSQDYRRVFGELPSATLASR